MPQPLPVGKSVQCGPNCILERPELAAQLGAVCANWSLIDDDILMLYSLLMGTYLPKMPGFEPPTHPVARQIFDALNALGPRLDLLVQLSKWQARPDEAEYLERKLRRELRKRFAERSKLVHGLWGICDDCPDALILQTVFGKPMIYKKRDFEKASERILATRKDLTTLIHQIYQRIRQ